VQFGCDYLDYSKPHQNFGVIDASGATSDILT